MARPDVPAVAEEFYRELGQTQPADEANGWPLLLLLGAVGSVIGRIHDLVRDTVGGRLGWTTILNPDLTPAWALRWLGRNFVGVELDERLDETAQRVLVASPPAFSRGTKSGMSQAMAVTLTGGKHTTVYENIAGNPYRLVAISYAVETPDPTATNAAAQTQVPIGMRVDYRTDPGWSVGQFEDAYTGQTIANAEAAFATVNALETRLPS
jgi:hypothetical protein